MTATAIHLGQSRVVGFFVLCSLFDGWAMIRMQFFNKVSSIGFFAAQLAFVLLSAMSAWYLYQTKSAGWYFGLATALNWFAMLGVKVIALNGYAIVVSAGMIVVLVWLLRPSVRVHLGVSS